MRFTRDKTYKLYDDGRLYNVVTDPLELSPLPKVAEFTEVREKLTVALAKFPVKGVEIDYEKVKGVRREMKKRRN